MTGVDGAAFEAIVLAAGAGSRFGGGKLLAPWRGGVLLDGALAGAFAAPVGRVIVVTGADAGAVGAAAAAYAARHGGAGRLALVHAADHAEGMGASLRTGAAALSPDLDGVFVFLGDMPRIPPGVADQLAAAVLTGAPAASAAYQGQRGHPTLIGADLIPGLLGLKGDAGARGVLKDLRQRLALIEAPDDGVLFDVDERGDLS